MTQEISTEIRHKHTQLAGLVLQEIDTLGLTNPTVLEIGCQPGWFALRMVVRTRYLGLEPSAAAAAEMRKHVPAAEVEVADFITWDPGGRRFDLVLLVDRISACADQRGVLDKVAKVLAPGGFLVLSTENRFVWNRQRFVKPPGPGEIRKWLTLSELHEMVARAGLERVKSYTVLPSGFEGVLKIINARKLNRPFYALFGEDRINRCKELVGLGQFRVLVARSSSLAHDA